MEQSVKVEIGRKTAKYRERKRIRFEKWKIRVLAGAKRDDVTTSEA